MKICFNLSRYQNENVSLVLHSRRSCSTRVSLVLHSLVSFLLHSCRTGVTSPVDTGRKLNVHKTFRKRPRRLLNVFRTFELRPVTTGLALMLQNRLYPFQLFMRFKNVRSSQPSAVTAYNGYSSFI